MAIECLKKKSCGHLRGQKCCGAFLPVHPAPGQIWSRDHKQLMSSTIGSFDYDQGNERRY